MRINTKSPTGKGKAKDLERIRNNQRRCRARQKDYIASLEDKIRQYEGMSIESTNKQKLDELATENRSLRRLLQSLGLRDEFLNAYGDALRIAPDVLGPPLGDEINAVSNDCLASNFSLNKLKTHLPTITIQEEQPQYTTGKFADVSTSRPAFLDWSQIDSPLSWEHSDLSAPSASSPLEQSGQLTMDTLMTEAFSNAVTVDNVSDTTTLCSLAFSLILRSNLKGYTAADLDLKLRAGYKHGVTPTEGCRIDNKVLLNVLAEVT